MQMQTKLKKMFQRRHEIIDSLEMPSEQNGKIKGEITVTGGVSKEEDDDDDIPPNISVENSLEKVKKLVETVDATPANAEKKSMADDIEAESSTVENTVSTQLKEGGNDNESEDAGTVEMDRAVLEKLSSEKGNADGESESSKGEKKASVGN
jgi:hypothetical protein